MDVYEAIERRRTIRAFTEGTSENILRKIIKAGARAMSAGNRQPWEFIIIDDPSLVEQIAEKKYQLNAAYPPIANAKLQKRAYFKSSVIAACYKEGPGHLRTMWACVQNMALAATAEGLGIIPSTLWEPELSNAEKLLGLPPDYHLATMVLVGKQRGYSRNKRPRIIRRDDFSWLHRNHFGTPTEGE